MMNIKEANELLKELYPSLDGKGSRFEITRYNHQVTLWARGVDGNPDQIAIHYTNGINAYAIELCLARVLNFLYVERLSLYANVSVL